MAVSSAPLEQLGWRDTQTRETACRPARPSHACTGPTTARLRCCGRHLWPACCTGASDASRPLHADDSGLWQQGFRYALKALDWASLLSVYFINDSVLGPLFRMETKPGLTVAAVWVGHVASSAVHAYNGTVLQDRFFIDFWNTTDFVCNKIGSMILLESNLFHLHGSNCSTYTNDINEFQRPPNRSASHPLPFYKHKNDGWLPAAHALRGRAAFDNFGRRVAIANKHTPSRLQLCGKVSPLGRRQHTRLRDALASVAIFVLVLLGLVCSCALLHVWAASTQE